MSNELKPVAVLRKVSGFERVEVCFISQSYDEAQTMSDGTKLYAIPKGYTLVKTQELESAFIYLDSFVDTEKDRRNICSNCGDVEIESPVDFTEAETALEHLKAAKEPV